MLFLLSPAKQLNYDSPLVSDEHTQPIFVEQAQELVRILRTKSQDEIATLMRLSPQLASLNVQRYAQWQPHFSLDCARQAILAFDGDVYAGLQAATLQANQLTWAQQHLLILSGLYGVLRPLDLMRAYRLEMGTRLETSRGHTLYQFWGNCIADYLNQRLAAEAAPTVINLASEEYFKAVDLKALNACVVQCVFQDWKNNTWKIISFYAKRARGLMARYAIECQASLPSMLCEFEAEGYRYVEQVSTPQRLVFRRKL